LRLGVTASHRVFPRHASAEGPLASLGATKKRRLVVTVPSCLRMFRLISLTLKPSYNIQDMRRERRKDSTNVLSLVLRDRSGCFGLSFPFLNLNQNIRLKSLHHNHDDRLQKALSHVKSLDLYCRYYFEMSHLIPNLKCHIKRVSSLYLQGGDSNENIPYLGG